MKGKIAHHTHNHSKGAKDERERIATELAPLEEQDQAAAQKQGGTNQSVRVRNQQSGAIVVDNSDLHIPKAVIEESDEKRFFGIEPVVLVIAGLMVLYIAFIAWQISLMPPPNP